MKQDKLEKFILDNRKQFDDLEPDLGIWDKIAENEDKKAKVRMININWKQFMWRAAAVTVIFTSSYFLWDIINKSDEPVVQKTIQQKDIFFENNNKIGELMEVEAYYTAQIETKKIEVFRFANYYPEVKKDIAYDFLELDKVYAELKTDLKDNLANEQVIEAMIQNYRIKLEILEELLHQLKSTNNDKTYKTIKHEI